jgi:hypothetical protein
VLLAPAGLGLLQALEQAPGVRRHPQQVRGLLQRLVVLERHQDRAPALRGDLDRDVVVIDLLS